MKIRWIGRAPALGLVAALVLGVVAGCTGRGGDHLSFATAKEAAEALVLALRKDDLLSLSALLGPDSGTVLSSGDEVQDNLDRDAFVAAYEKQHTLVDAASGKKLLLVGEQLWPLPVPLVERGGRWQFDGAAGAEELVFRRIGANELGAIDVCRGYVTAQQEYAAVGRDGDPAGIYALKLISDPGTQNGLYWESAAGEAMSPAGPFVAAAASEGYRAATDGRRQAYHGYYYRMLYSQGPNANGGAGEYFVDGLLTRGFALVAWPADYGVSGVQTFIVNQDGVVFQKDLGADTARAVEAISRFDPDGTWTAITPEATPAG
jgi:hypothetical protein